MIFKLLPLGVVLSALVISSCAFREGEKTSAPQSVGGVDIGQYEGYEAVNKKIRDRLLDLEHPPSRTFRLGMYLNVGRYSRGLTNLLGAFAGAGVDNEYRNGNPNAVNTALWHLSLKIFVWHYVDCEESRSREFYKIQREAFRAVRNLCSWPDRDSFDERDLERVWTTFMGWEAPEEEFLAWKDFVMADESPLWSMDADQAIETMVHALVLNPYFLIEN